MVSVRLVQLRFVKKTFAFWSIIQYHSWKKSSSRKDIIAFHRWLMLKSPIQNNLREDVQKYFTRRAQGNDKLLVWVWKRLEVEMCPSRSLSFHHVLFALCTARYFQKLETMNSNEKQLWVALEPTLAFVFCTPRLMSHGCGTCRFPSMPVDLQLSSRLVYSRFLKVVVYSRLTSSE